MESSQTKPLRIALLGAEKSGKTAFLAKLMTGAFTQTYYPTRQVVPHIFQFTPKSAASNVILDEYATLQEYTEILQLPLVALSKAIVNRLRKNQVSFQRRRKSGSKGKRRYSESKANGTAYSYTLPEKLTTEDYVVPQISPILSEMVDTPSFHPEQVVPFLEASLDVKLAPDVLHNLATEPKRDHSTKALITASGASELNGSIDGYIFVYSCVPSMNPPTYEELAPGGGNTNEGDEPINMLRCMKNILVDAWQQYRQYKTGWEKGKEGDVFSLVYSIKSLWKNNKIEEQQKRKQTITPITSPDSISSASDGDCDDTPPMVIVCTHSDCEMKSPQLIEKGRNLASKWGCSFVEASSLTGQGIEEGMALMIREIVERKYQA